MSEAASIDTQAQPKRVLGQADATAVVIGAIIGVGIFFNPSKVAQLAGSADLALAAWSLAGVIALLGALTFAELGGRYHASGAQYDILRDAYGPVLGFAFVLCNATAIQAGAIGVIAVVCVQNLCVALGSALPSEETQLAIATLLAACLTAANIIGVKWGSRIQNVTVLAKLVTLAAIVALALFAAPAHETVAAPEAHAGRGFSGILAALVPAFFAYGGWQHSLWISGEVREPMRFLPRAIIVGVVLVVAAYVLTNWAYLRLLGVANVKESSSLAADAVRVVLGETGRRCIAAAVAVSAFGVLNAQLLSGPRLVYRLAADGRFFSPFGRLSARFGTPVGAIALLGGMGVFLLWATWLARYFGAEPKVLDLLVANSVLIDGVFFVFTGGALILLRRRLPATAGTFATPLFPLIPALFVLGEIGVVIGAHLPKDQLIPALFGLGWIVAAFLIYAIFVSRRPAR